MRLFAAAAGGLATLLCLIGLANAGVVRRADNHAAEAVPTKVTPPGGPFTGPFGQIGTCCKDGCTDCTWADCFLADACDDGSEYTQCCFDVHVVTLTMSLEPFPTDTGGSHVPEIAPGPEISTLATLPIAEPFHHRSKTLSSETSSATIQDPFHHHTDIARRDPETSTISTLPISDPLHNHTSPIISSTATVTIPGPLSTLSIVDPLHHTTIAQRDVDSSLTHPRCCTPGCKVCRVQDCWGGACDRNAIFNTCCADRKLLANAIFVDDVESSGYPICCLPGCKVCTVNSCWSVECNSGLFNTCCSDKELLANAIFVDEASQALALDSPTPTIHADSVEPVKVRQVEGPNPTPWCCQPGCLVCGGWTCWQRECPTDFTSCCADMFLLSQAIFINDTIHPDAIEDVPAVSARQLEDPDRPHVYGAAAGNYLAIMADEVEPREAQVSGQYGGGGNIGNTIMAPNVAVTARQPQDDPTDSPIEAPADQPTVYGGQGPAQNTLVAPNVAVTARQPQDDPTYTPADKITVYGGVGPVQNTLDAPNDVVTARQPDDDQPIQYGGGAFGYQTIMASAAASVVPREAQVSGQYGGGGVIYQTIMASDAAVTARHPQVSGHYGGGGVIYPSIEAPDAAVTAAASAVN